MNWRFKNAAFHALQYVPMGSLAYETSQRLVTRRLLPKISPSKIATYRIPLDVFLQIPGATTAMEFGAGRSLVTPLLFHTAQAEKVIAFDLQRLAHLASINAAIAALSKVFDGEWPAVASFADLAEKYRIDYRAPGDARATGLPNQSLDLIYSTATLEHIPPAEIIAILGEARRILKPGGRLCFTIDYHDHFASSDKAIGYFNFYQYSTAEWKRYNTPLHFQNRLRHSDYTRIFEDAGWTIHRGERLYDSWSDSDLKRVKLHAEFAEYAPEDLRASNGIFVLGRD